MQTLPSNTVVRRRRDLVDLLLDSSRETGLPLIITDHLEVDFSQRVLSLLLPCEQRGKRRGSEGEDGWRSRRTEGSTEYNVVLLRGGRPETKMGIWRGTEEEFSSPPKQKEGRAL